MGGEGKFDAAIGVLVVAGALVSLAGVMLLAIAEAQRSVAGRSMSFTAIAVGIALIALVCGIATMCFAVLSHRARRRGARAGNPTNS